MKIKVVEANREQLQAAIKSQVGDGIHVHGVDHILSYAPRGERWLDRHSVPKAARRGVQVCVRGYERVPNCYGFDRKASEITLERGSRDWYLVAVSRAELHPSQGGRLEVRLTETAESEIHRVLAKEYTVIRPEGSPEELP